MPSSNHSRSSAKSYVALGKNVPSVERRAAARLISLLSPDSPKPCRKLEVIGAQGEHVELPSSLTEVMYQAAELLAAGQSVAVLPDGDMLSTQTAADLLNVSRQYLVRLVDSNRLPAIKVGSHRRLALSDVLAYKAKRDVDRTSALDRLAELTEEAGGYAISQHSP